MQQCCIFLDEVLLYSWSQVNETSERSRNTRITVFLYLCDGVPRSSNFWVWKGIFYTSCFRLSRVLYVMFHIGVTGFQIPREYRAQPLFHKLAGQFMKQKQNMAYCWLVLCSRTARLRGRPSEPLMFVWPGRKFVPLISSVRTRLNLWLTHLSINFAK